MEGLGVWRTFEGVPVTLGAPFRLAKESICYAVAGNPSRPQDALLLVQEAKPEYDREGIVAALRREVKEESGLECEPLTLLALEERGPAWIRFSFLARAEGGSHLPRVSAAVLEEFKRPEIKKNQTWI
uniref:Nudix hydrolase domain-containing protein n=1 Tax=Malurus cyaneus samueli TaxID=2593467 RepID=A0A8C5TEC0_9PASS